MIEFQHVGKTYPDGTVAVEDFSLTAPSRQTTVLVGTSGSGKTTVLRMVNRMIEPTSGCVLWDGVDVAGMEPVKLRRSIGYVLQEGGLFPPHWTVLDNIGTVPRLEGATRQDSARRAAEVVTKAFAEANNVKSIADLAGLDGLVLAGNSELETRPYGPKGLKNVYGVEISPFKPVEDSGGPLTVKALRDGDATVVDLYSSTPTLSEGDLVVLDDPKGLFLASYIVPVVSANVDDGAVAAIDAVSAALTPEELIAMNGESVNDARPAADIAKDFLKRAGLL